MNVADADKKARRKPKVWAPKVKTGCITCRARRVKCDEGKPSCLQCARVKRTCDGYSKPDEKPLKETSSATRQLPTLHPKIREVSTKLFDDDKEEICFQYFLQHTSTSLSGPFKSALWTRLIPQASMTSPAVRHAVISISALNLVVREPGSLPLPEMRDISSGQSEKYHQFAVHQYSKALTQMRDLSENDEDSRTRLITCILIVCFETFYGNQQSALAQLRTGISLINRCAETTNGIIEDELFDTFNRLDLYVMMLLQSRPSTRDTFTRVNRRMRSIQIPELFSSIHEANLALWSFQSRMLQLHDENIDVIVPDQEPGSQMSITELPSHQFSQRNKLLDDLTSWHLAFDPIFQQLRTTQAHPDYLGAMILRLHYLTIYLTAASTLTGHTSRRREYIPIFSEMVSLSRLIIRHPTWKSNRFTFHGQTIKPLYTVAGRCPHSAIRRQAIALLLEFPRRESFWDSTLCGKCAEWIMKFEEEDTDTDGYVPDEARIVYFSVDPDLMSRSAKVMCRRPELATGRVIERMDILWW